MSTLKIDTLQNVAGSLSVPTATIVNGSAKAWVNFNGTGTVAIRASFNVSSITDNGTGDYTVNFTSAMVDANYNTSGTVSGAGVTAGTGALSLNTYNGAAGQSTSSVRVVQSNAAGGATDRDSFSVTIFR